MRPRRTRQQPAAVKRPRHTLDLAWNDDEHIDSSEDDEGSLRDKEPLLQEEEESSGEEETPDVKRVRLARQYLETINARSDESSSGEEEANTDDDNDVLARKLQRDRLKRQGTLERALAQKVLRHVTALQEAVLEERPALLSSAAAAADLWVQMGFVRLLGRRHDLTPTSVAVDPAGRRAISGSKDHSVILWDLEKGSALMTLCQQWKKKKKNNNDNNKKGERIVSSRTAGQVLSVALSDDGRFAAVGKRDGRVSVFDVRSSSDRKLIQQFEGHKGAVTCLTFRTQSNQLFSGSEDRCIRHYNLDEMLYMETLYGHQFGVTGIDCHGQEKPVSVGRDRTARAWKLQEDTHLIFRGGSKLPSAECVAVIKDDWFVTGHEDGTLSLWMTEKKKAVAFIENAHGAGNAVVCVGTCKGSDVVASGSNDGYLRLWKVRTGQTLQERGIEPLCRIPVRGYINSIGFGPKAKFCVVAVGQEHRCGRWDRVKGAKNRIAIVNLHSESVEEEGSDGENSQQEGDVGGANASSSSEDAHSESDDSD